MSPMSDRTRQSRPATTYKTASRIRRAQHGQALVVALAVLFILLFIGGLFVTRVARNLISAGRARETNGALAFAHAGIDYCNNQLNSSIDGADWRPTPTAPLAAAGDVNGFRDPDYFWLSKGYSRIPLVGGRALVRVSYDPHPEDPNGQKLKIESLGRSGELAINDPTVFVTNQNAPRLRREQIAYKPIGITDNLRFITDKDHRGGENYLGTPAIGRNVATIYGNPMLGNPLYASGKNGNHILYGAPIRSNANLTLGGDIHFYLSPEGTTNGAHPEQVLTAGKFNLSPNRGPNDKEAWLNTAIDVDPNGNAAAQYIYGSDDPAGFNTYNGLIRDGSSQSDVSGYSRGVSYLAPPRLDTFGNGSGVLRYRMLTRDSGYWVKGANGQEYNTGQFGYGRNVYIDNFEDQQPETTTPGINGSYSLPADWTNPNAGFSQSFWNGQHYNAPGVTIELLGDFIKITRHDSKSWYNFNGSSNPNGDLKTIMVPLSDIDRSQVNDNSTPPKSLQPLPHDGDEPGAAKVGAGDKNSYGVNLVIMAEGNVNVRGVYGAVTNNVDVSETISGGVVTARKLGRVHLTIVSGGTAYIEGNVVKGDGFINGTGGAFTAEHNSTCAIMAKNYICVNTSKFMQTNARFDREGNRDYDTFAAQIAQNTAGLDTTFSFGVDPNAYNIPPFLLVRQTATSAGLTPMNFLLNPAYNPGAAAYTFANPNDPSGFEITGAPGTYPLGQKQVQGAFLDDPSSVSTNFEARAFPFTNYVPNAGLAFTGGFNLANVIPSPGVDNLLRIMIDQSFITTASNTLVSDMMVAPLDIRIEALLYAQDKSFFIIPGYSFNPDPNDTRERYVANGAVRVSYNDQDKADVLAGTTSFQRHMKDIFPYANEPLDVRITIFGAVSENYTASVGAQAAWMAKWGYIPATFGSSGETIPTLHLNAIDPAGYVPGQDPAGVYRTPLETNAAGAPFQIPITRGLRFIYDPALAMPYFDPTNTQLSDPAAGGSNIQTRKQYALRYIDRQVSNGATNLYRIRQVLPAMPRLPVCPGILYTGESERLLGTGGPGDSDQY